MSFLASSPEQPSGLARRVEPRPWVVGRVFAQEKIVVVSVVDVGIVVDRADPQALTASAVHDQCEV